MVMHKRLKPNQDEVILLNFVYFLVRILHKFRLKV